MKRKEFKKLNWSDQLNYLIGKLGKECVSDEFIYGVNAKEFKRLINKIVEKYYLIEE